MTPKLSIACSLLLCGCATRGDLDQVETRVAKLERAVTGSESRPPESASTTVDAAAVEASSPRGGLLAGIDDLKARLGVAEAGIDAAKARLPAELQRLLLANFGLSLVEARSYAFVELELVSPALEAAYADFVKTLPPTRAEAYTTAVPDAGAFARELVFRQGFAPPLAVAAGSLAIQPSDRSGFRVGDLSIDEAWSAAGDASATRGEQRLSAPDPQRTDEPAIRLLWRFEPSIRSQDLVLGLRFEVGQVRAEDDVVRLASGFLRPER